MHKLIINLSNAQINKSIKHKFEHMLHQVAVDARIRTIVIAFQRLVRAHSVISESVTLKHSINYTN